MIAVLNENHADEFIRLRLSGLRESPLAFGASPEDGLDRGEVIENLKKRSEENFILGYFRDDRLIGIVGFVRQKRIKQKHKAFIWGMYVDPVFRGLGIGEKLMLDIIQRTKNLDGLSKIVLSVTHLQQDSKRFYQKLGFIQYAVEKDALRVSGQKIDEIFMCMKI